jgi:hypothetical protein
MTHSPHVPSVLCPAGALCGVSPCPEGVISGPSSTPIAGVFAGDPGAAQSNAAVSPDGAGATSARVAKLPVEQESQRVGPAGSFSDRIDGASFGIRPRHGASGRASRRSSRLVPSNVSEALLKPLAKAVSVAARPRAPTRDDISVICASTIATILATTSPIPSTVCCPVCLWKP